MPKILHDIYNANLNLKAVINNTKKKVIKKTNTKNYTTYKQIKIMLRMR